ncbi:MAG: DUF5686 and carboxypeptidase regulatory-like domain-containing protein, partial [Bacteroidia bacterium]|nr:DUF5686 and carboxypeptidase regulatory-like domain-containing protein [Bacteroidia bacterium]
MTFISDKSSAILKYAFFLLLFSYANTITAQKLTTIKGRVFDAKTKQPLPFVDVTLKGTYIGVSTDLDGQYLIQTRNPSDTIECSFLSYKTISQRIKQEEKQTIDFYMEEEGYQLESVTILAKKGKYRKKNNPAVDLMRKVIANRDKNKIESKDFYQYDKHEKLELDLNNITEEFKQKKAFRNFEFLWEYLDTSTVNGRVYLPVYLREILAKVYYKKDGNEKKEVREAIKMTTFDEALDEQSITSIIDLLYQDIDLYDNNVNLLDNDFLSPMAPWALNYYRFYILDTTYVNNKEAIHLAFIPRNKAFIGFTGDVYISNDGRYSLLKAVLGITKDISMNFVRDIKVVQEYDEVDSVYILTRDDITLDIALSKGGIGMYASRSNTTKNHKFTPPDDPSVFNYTEEITTLDGAYEQADFYWANNRLNPLDEKQEGIYNMIDTLRTVPAYKKFIWFTRVITTGYIPAGPIDIGQISTMYTFNPTEGTRFRLGLESAFRRGRKYQAKTYLAYGLRDKKLKYSGSFLWSFNDDFIENPRHYIKGLYRHDVVFPGLKLEFIEEANLLTSFRRGDANQMLLLDSWNLDYVNESGVGFFKIGLEHRKRQPYGTMVFEAFRNDQPNQSVPDVTTSEISFAGEFSPNTAFIQGREIRTPIKSEHPRFQLSYRAGFKAAGGDFSYHNISLQMKKQVPMSVLGRGDIQIEVGRVFGKGLPFVLLYIPKSNQAYSFQPTSFNTMNFIEFVTDKYARVNYQHYFDGYIFNRIPLIKKLKLKEVIGFKVIHGGLDDANDPRINPDLIQFNRDADGNYLTSTFDGKTPFVEYSVGMYNIFRFI